MAQEFKIPGLTESITEIAKLQVSVKLLAADLLLSASNAEKVAGAFKNNSDLKGFVELQKKAKDTQGETATAAKKLEDAQVRLKTAQSDLGKQIAAVNIQTQQQNQVNKAQAQAVELVDASLKKETTSIAEARQQNALLTQARNAQSTTTVEGKNKLIEFNAAIDKNNAFIKLNGDATLKQKMNIGNYSESIQDASGKLGLFDGKLGGITKTVIGFVQGGAQAAKQVKDLNDTVVNGVKNFVGFGNATKRAAEAEEVLKMQIIATTTATEASAVASELSSVANTGLAVTTEAVGVASETTAVGVGVLDVVIGILAAPVTLVVAAFALLVYVFKDFAPLINPIKDALSAVMAVFEVLKTSVFEFATGAKSLSEVFIGLGGNMSKAAEEAYKLAAAEREIIKLTREQEISGAKYSAEITKLMVQSKNRTLSEQERMDFLKKAIDLEKQKVTEELVLNNKSIASARMKLSEGKNISDAEMVELAKGNANYAQSIKKKYNLDQEYIDNLRKLQVQRFGIIEADSRVAEKAQNFLEKNADAKEIKEQKAAENAQKANEKTQKQAEDNAKKALDNQKKSAELLIATKKTTLDFIIASYKQEENTEDENLAHVKTVSLQKQAIADLEMKKSLIGVAKGSLDEKNIRQKTSDEIQKIKLEETNALSKIQVDGVKAELELFKLKNGTLIKEGASLTDLLVNQEKDRLQKELDLNLKFERVSLDINNRALNEKIKNNEKLTENERSYLTKKKTLEDKFAKDEKSLDKGVFDYKMKLADDEFKAADKRAKSVAKTGAAGAILSRKLENNALAFKKKALQEELKSKKAGSDEYNKIQEQIKAGDDAVTENKIANINDGFNIAIAIFGKESAAGKAFAVAQIGFNTYQAASKLFLLGIEETALAAANTAAFNYVGAALHTAAATYAYIGGGMAIAEGTVQAGKVLGMFETGTNFAPYTGLAIVDEKGAEIHADKFGNIKSFGSDKGAHLTDIVKGDTIIPADISAIIKQTMFKSYGTNSNQIDYDKMGFQFDKSAGKIVKAISNKKEASLSVIVQRNITDRVMFKGKNV